MSEFLIIQNTKIEGIGTLGDLLKADGFRTKTILAKNEKIPENKYDAMIILGAPESANDDLPYLKQEIKLICDSVEKEIPVLGICLGSQLIAKAFDARVYNGHRKEIGFYDDIEFDNTSQSKLFSGIKSPSSVFHWHGDTFDLPKDAILLASSEICKNQAFIWNNQVLGLQFHIEVTESSIGELIKSGKSELIEAPFIQSASKIQEGYQYIPTCHILLESVIEKFLTLKSL